ncbi:hypothetical protein Pmar_PMAR009664 [Perkinsus marinus ATCC 50983]|uniref:Uncharacterized protein n=1 Tax=Perkinsus marinus (strain ATCC 50983 / TXsc) TaxID=423536 RepID=C5K8E5_PERM5|nr:hypothetical protein Pmar_PMAR009664 [Perkinsus marinus ATCC 50983]EER19243.1 hypothetical protein Pmar_PMAR009664 [Perkinsus marinus ATCC 50983]|eukprot:XP_002787447.1 hypothetical protein Pmar_PMAR009664 [Perkinsus marinus ATCC 50983]
MQVNSIQDTNGDVESILLQSDAPSCFSIGSLGCLQRSSSLNDSDIPSGSIEAPTLWVGPTIRPDASSQFLIPVFTIIWKSIFPSIVDEPFLVGRAIIDIRALSSFVGDAALIEEGNNRMYLTTRQGTVISARQPLASYVEIIGSDSTARFKSVWESSDREQSTDDQNRGGPDL